MSIEKKTIIGRKEELGILDEIFDSSRPEFTAVYGRRRVGKTYLIEQFFVRKPCLYFSITGIRKGTLKEQLNNFTQSVNETFYSEIGAKIEAPTSWMKAFEILTNIMTKYSKEKRIVLFFDEVPWLSTPKSGFLNSLDYCWNTKWSKNDKIVLVVCGSVASWIINNIINNTGGLHNRITREIRIFPFSLQESFDYLNYLKCKFNQKQVIELYMVMGGIPHYLSKIKSNLSATQNISKLFFSRSGALFKEFDKLFASLFDNPKTYIELIMIIAEKREGVSRNAIEAKAKLSESGGTLTNRLESLEHAGFIKSFIPIGYQEKGLYYKLVDEYCLFYLRWIKPIWRQIENEDESECWLSKHNTPAWYNWTGYAFEAICLKHVTQIRKALFIPKGALAGSWRYQKQGGQDRVSSEGAQIDLLFDRKDGVVTLCEIKYSQELFEIDKPYAAALERKIKIFKEHSKINKNIFLAMITSEGLKKNRYSEELITGKVTMNDLFLH
jgi:predicted AAA+ superfamily ATPase